MFRFGKIGKLGKNENIRDVLCQRYISLKIINTILLFDFLIC